MEAKPKNTGKFAKGNPGKPKGAKSHTTRSAMQAIEMAAEGLGGVKRLIAWAKSDEANERVFWGSIYTKLLPLQVSGDPENPLRTVARIELVALSE